MMTRRWFSPKDRALEPGVNIFSDEESIVWLMLVRDCDSYDLVLEECGDGVHPVDNAIEWMWDSDGLEGWIRLDNYGHKLEINGYSWDFYGASFGLENGIAPGQMFAVSLGRPVTIECHGDYGVDYDVETEFDIVAIEKWPNSKSLKAWERYLSYLKKKTEKEMLLADVLKSKPLGLDCFSLTWTPHNSLLYLNYEHFCPLLDHVYARSNGKTFDEAKQNLVKSMIKDNKPTKLSVDELSQLPVKTWSQTW